MYNECDIVGILGTQCTHIVYYKYIQTSWDIVQTTKAADNKIS